MPFIPNELDAFHASQASPDSGHFEGLRGGSKATGVVSGCLVSAQGTPDMTVAVAPGVISWAGTRANVTAGNLTLTADGTNPRFYIIVASSAGVKSAVAGTPAPEMAPGVRGPAWPAIPASSIVLASVYIPAADTDIDANQIDDVRVFVVPPEPTTNYDLAKARSIPLVKERSQTVTLDTGQNQIHALLRARGKLFATTQTSPAYFIRFNNPEDLTDRTSFQFDSDGDHGSSPAAVYVEETGKIYVMFDHATKTVVSSVDPDTHTVVDVIDDATNAVETNGSMCSDGTNLYIVTSGSPSKVLKYRLSDFTLQGTATLTGRNNGHSALYDGVNVYATGNISAAWIAKITTSDMTFTDANLPTGITTQTDDLASVGDYLFCGGEGGVKYNLVRINKSDLTSEVIRSSADAIYAIHFDGRYLWLGHNTTPGKLSRVDPSSGDYAVHTFPTGEDAANEIVSDGERLFVSFYMSPAKVKRLVPPAMPVPGQARVTTHAVSSTAVSNTGASEQTLLSTAGPSALPGLLLNRDGAALRVTTSGWFAANGNNKRILLKFGLASPVTVFDTGSLAFNNTNWWLEAKCIRTGANGQKWVTKWMSDSSLLATKVQRATTTQADTGTLNVNVRGVGVSDADVTNEELLVEVVN